MIRKVIWTHRSLRGKYILRRLGGYYHYPYRDTRNDKKCRCKVCEVIPYKNDSNKLTLYVRQTFDTEEVRSYYKASMICM